MGAAPSVTRARTVARGQARILQDRANVKRSENGDTVMADALPVFVGIDVATAAVPLVVADPRQIRDFAGAAGPICAAPVIRINPE